MITSVKRALATLTYLAQHREARVTDIAVFLQVNKSNASRLLQTLANEGYVDRCEQSGRYRLGLSAANVGLAFLQSFELRDVVRPFLMRLFEQTEETVLLVIPTTDGSAMCIDKIEPTHYLRTHARIGERVPIHCGSAAKALLAHMSEARIDELVRSAPLEQFTPNTITDPKKLNEELARIRDLGYSISKAETTLGVAGVAAPVFDHTGKAIAALSVGGPDTRLTPQRISEFSTYVLESAREASMALGYGYQVR